MVDRDLRMCLTAGHLAEASEERRGEARGGGWSSAVGCEVCSQAELPDLVNSRKPCSVN